MFSLILLPLVAKLPYALTPCPIAARGNVFAHQCFDLIRAKTVRGMYLSKADMITQCHLNDLTYWSSIKFFVIDHVNRISFSQSPYVGKALPPRVALVYSMRISCKSWSLVYWFFAFSSISPFQSPYFPLIMPTHFAILDHFYGCIFAWTRRTSYRAPHCNLIVVSLIIVRQIEIPIANSSETQKSTCPDAVVGKMAIVVTYNNSAGYFLCIPSRQSCKNFS